MRPLANYQCSTCKRKIEDLPIDSIRCPYCGRKRGFIRLFDSIGGIITSASRTVDKVIQQTMDPLYDKHAKTTEGAKRFETLGTDAIEKTFEQATTEERKQIKPFGGTLMPATAAMQSIPPSARQDSREVIYPALTNRKVSPQWQR